jgi:hypothetical protein
MLELPLRMVISGPSGSGKGILTSKLLLETFRNRFQKIYYFSASSRLDENLGPLQKYCEKHLGQGENDPCLYDTWDEAVLENILERQKKVCDYVKAQNSKRKFHICIVCDDFATERTVVRGGTLEKLFLRGRHFSASVLVLTQYYRLLSPSIRTNATALAVFRLRSGADKEAIMSENSAIVKRKTLEALYDIATSNAFSFLLILLAESDPSKMLFSGLETRLIPPNANQPPP